MASPFRYFRKNAKVMLAVFVVLLMLSWVVGDSLFTLLSDRRAAGPGEQLDANAVAVSWDGGSLTNQQLGLMIMQRHALRNFLERVITEGARKAYEAGVEPSPLRVQVPSLLYTRDDDIERDVVITKLLAGAARETGMRVSDDSVVQYFDQLGRGNVPRAMMREIIQGMQSQGRSFSIDDVVNTMRDEMLRQNYLASDSYSFGTVTPEQRWQDWLKVNERVIVEAVALPAESFLVDVKAPTDADLQLFFDQYKEREAGPVGILNVELPSATPGFRIPQKIDIEYIEANFDEFVAKAEEKVTDEEIAKYYEDHKDPMFIKAPTGLIDDVPAEAKDADKPAEGATQPEAKDAPTETKDAASAPPSESAPARADAQPKDAVAEEKEAPATGPPSEEPEANENPPVPANDEKKDDGATDDGKQSSQIAPMKSAFRLAGFQQEAAKDVPTTEQPANAPETPESPPPAADARPASPPAAGAEAASTPPPPPATTAEALPPAQPAAGESATPAAPPKPKEFQPLEEVKDQIRKQIATDKVSEELDKLMKDIAAGLDAEFQKYYRQVLTAEAAKQTPPAPPESLMNLKSLAEKHGLKNETTGPQTVLQLRDSPVGKSAVPDTARPLWYSLFGTKEYDLYQPIQTRDIFGNRYIVVKKSDAPGRVPTLADLRPEVEKAWKTQKAAEIAEKTANELAKKINDAKTPLATYFADDPTKTVVRTDPFSYLTGGDVGVVGGQFQQQPYRLSQPDRIVAPGPEFMDAVFKLNDGEAGAALNNDHSVAYVIRLVEHQPPMDELRTAYLAEAANWPGLNQMLQAQAQYTRGTVINDMMAALNLKFTPKPKQDGEVASMPESEGAGG